MYHVMRVALCGVGHPDARFNPLVLDLRDFSNGMPRSEALVWLDNGGGKTSQISLISSLILPHQKDFLGSRSDKERRSLGDYVLPTDVSHVFIEWGRPAAGLFAAQEGPVRLVTGQVITRSGDELDRTWYSFFPVDGYLTFDDLLGLVHTLEGRRNSLDGFLGGIQTRARESAENPRLVITPRQGRWLELLQDRGIDPEIYRYQLRMNEDEGGAGKFLNFKDGDSFVEFVLGLVTDPDTLSPVVTDLARLADEYAAQPNVQAEALFCEGVDTLTPPLVGALGQLKVARDEQRDAVAEGVALLASLVASGRASRREASEQNDLAARHEGRRSDLDREVRTWQDAITTLGELAAREEHECAKAALEQTDADLLEAKIEADAWAITDEVLHERNLRERVDALSQQLGRLHEGATHLHEAQEMTGARYRARLDHQFTNTRRELADARAEERQIDRLLDELNQRSSLDRVQEGRLSARLEDLNAKAAGLRRELASLQEEGLLLANETVATAAARFTAEADEHAGRLASINEEIRRLDEELPGLREMIAQANQETATLEQSQESLVVALTGLRQRIDAISSEDEVRECLAGQPFDPARHGVSVCAHLDDRRHEARQQAISLEVRSRAAARARAYLESNDVLPPEPHVEEAVRLLAAKGFAAQSGWSYLEENYRGEALSRALSAHPDLAAGVTVKTGELEPAAKLLRPAGSA